MNRGVDGDESAPWERSRTTHFYNREELITKIVRFLHFFRKVLASTPGISLTDRENSSGEIIFESAHIYPELKYLKE